MWKLVKSVEERLKVIASDDVYARICALTETLLSISINPAIATTFVCVIVVLIWTHGDSKKEYYKFAKASLLPCLSLLMTKCVFSLYFYGLENTVTPCFETRNGVFKEITVICVFIDVVFLIHPLFFYVNPTTEPENKFKSFKILFLTVFGYLMYCISIYPILSSTKPDGTAFGDVMPKDVLLDMSFNTAALVFLYVCTIFIWYLIFHLYKNQPKVEAVWEFKKKPVQKSEVKKGEKKSSKIS